MSSNLRPRNVLSVVFFLRHFRFGDAKIWPTPTRPCRSICHLVSYHKFSLSIWWEFFLAALTFSFGLTRPTDGERDGREFFARNWPSGERRGQTCNQVYLVFFFKFFLNRLFLFLQKNQSVFGFLATPGRSRWVDRIIRSERKNILKNIYILRNLEEKRPQPNGNANVFLFVCEFFFLVSREMEKHETDRQGFTGGILPGFVSS